MGAIKQIDRAIAFYEAGEPALAEGRLRVALDVIGRELCRECRGYGAQARVDGYRYDSAGPDCPCPSCGATASGGAR